ncbi:hypothetical protein [Haloarcula sp. JP-L23]|uniref:hypothetical protein n=1 Tax=Haloarcula sp. JP-L23 TaxID=2716717 RepID=UPI00140F0186|nr:hypothetical protein G9465_21720 [Haloarcula sp. JP-L23]
MGRYESTAVDHVNAHATSTPIGDAREAEGLESVFAFTATPSVTSVMGHLGHALGGAGAIEATVVVQTISTDIAPPTANYETPDPDCKMPVLTESCEGDIEVVVSTSAGFGGINAALVLE